MRNERYNTNLRKCSASPSKYNWRKLSLAEKFSFPALLSPVYLLDTFNPLVDTILHSEQGQSNNKQMFVVNKYSLFNICNNVMILHIGATTFFTISLNLFCENKLIIGPWEIYIIRSQEKNFYLNWDLNLRPLGSGSNFSLVIW